MQSITVPTTSQIAGTVDNNHQHVSATAPNVTSATNKTINLVANDASGNTAATSFSVTIKPLHDKYRVGTSSTDSHPVRIANIANNATISQADQTAIINSLTFTTNAPNRSYATASANEITSKTVSNVHRSGNNASVTVTVTYQDGTTSTVNVPVKHVIPEIVFIHITLFKVRISLQVMVLVRLIILNYQMEVQFLMRQLLGLLDKHQIKIIHVLVKTLLYRTYFD